MTREDFQARVIHLDAERRRRELADERRARKLLYPRSGNVVPLGARRPFHLPPKDAA